MRLTEKNIEPGVLISFAIQHGNMRTDSLSVSNNMLSFCSRSFLFIWRLLRSPMCSGKFIDFLFSLLLSDICDFKLHQIYNTTQFAGHWAFSN